jgi:hypothetical protein
MTTNTDHTQELTDKINESTGHFAPRLMRPSRTKPIAHGSTP